MINRRATNVSSPMMALQSLRTALFLLSAIFVLQTAAAHSIFYRTVPFHDSHANSNSLNDPKGQLEEIDHNANYQSIADVVENEEKAEESPAATEESNVEDDDEKWDVIVPGGVATIYNSDMASRRLLKESQRHLGRPRPVRRLVILKGLPEEEEEGSSAENEVENKSESTLTPASSSNLDRPVVGHNLQPRLHTHLMALRPDYAFRNIANIFRNFFDSRIERSRKNSNQQQQENKEE